MPPQQTQVSLQQGQDRRDVLQRTLTPVLDTMPWDSYRRVVVKPNLVSIDSPLAITHPDALDTLLTLVRQRYGGDLTIAEGCALHETPAAFVQQGYPALAEQHHCHLLDLNADATLPVSVFDDHERPLHLELSRTVVESDCRISLSLPKTHDAVLITLSIKNIIMASLVNRRLTDCRRRAAWQDRMGQILHGHGNGWGSDKVAMHQRPPIMNINLALLAPLVWPQLSVLDGFVAMEGAGPIHGDGVDWGIALAGTDALAVDATATRLMGFAVEEIGYLNHCAQMGLGRYREADINIWGIAPATVERPFRDHPAHQQQRQWAHENVQALLAHKPLTQMVMA